MRILAKRTLREYWERHPETRDALSDWHRETKAAHWAGPADVKRVHPKASIVGNNRVVFNIRGNRFRLVVRVDYRAGIVFIRFIGTHGEYDRIDATEV